jgi:hypothetical protein
MKVGDKVRNRVRFWKLIDANVRILIDENAMGRVVNVKSATYKKHGEPDLITVRFLWNFGEDFMIEVVKEIYSNELELVNE